MPNTQMVMNPKQELETINFDSDIKYDKNEETFHHLVSIFASYDKLVLHKDKVSRFLRTLLPRFAPIANVAEVNSVSIEKTRRPSHL